MHKCIDCGTEFEGKFCPQCGKPRLSDGVCPKCGAPIQGGARFCSECGFSFEGGKAFSASNAAERDSSLHKVYRFLRYIPALLFILFSLLAFAFLASPLVSVADLDETELFAMGGFEEEADFEISINAYTGLSDEDFSGAAAGFIAFGVLGLCLAAVTFAFTFCMPLKGARLKLSANAKIPLFVIFRHVCYAFYFAFFLLGCIVSGRIAAFDEGAGILKAGACPILFIVFPILFGLFSAAATVARYFIGKNYPAWKEDEKARDEENYLEFRDAKALKEERERVRAEWTANYKKNNPAPVEPVMAQMKKPTKPALKMLVERTPELEREVDKAVRKKRASVYLCFLIPLAIFSWIGAIIGGKKRVGFRPEKVAKRKWLSFGTWLNLFWAVGALAVCLIVIIIALLQINEGDAKYAIPMISDSAIFIIPAFYFFIMFGVGRKNMRRLNLLCVKLYGYKKPYASPQFKESVKRYRTDDKNYKRAVKNNKQYKYEHRAEFAEYRAACARYEAEMNRKLNAVLKSVKISHES